MSGQDTEPNGPAVVFTYAGSGIPRLRSMLEACPEMEWIAGVNLVQLCDRVAHDWKTIDDSRDRLSVLAQRGIRSLVQAMVIGRLAGSGKRRWCTPAVGGMPELTCTFASVFPQARFVSLHRNCLDVIYAGLAACPWGRKLILVCPAFAPVVWAGCRHDRGLWRRLACGRGPSERLDLPGRAGVLGAARRGGRGRRGYGEGREAEGRQAPAARHGVFRDGAGAFRRGGLRGDLGPYLGGSRGLGVLGGLAGRGDDGRDHPGTAAARRGPGEGDVRAGRGPGGDGGHAGGVPRAVAEDEHRRPGVDVPDTEANAAAFGYPGSGKDGSPAAYPKARR